jgi:hypothetical protein
MPRSFPSRASLAAGLATLTMSLSLAAPAEPRTLDGEWGGERLRLFADATGLRLEGECWSGATTGAVRLDAQGRFALAGRLQEQAPGQAPQAGDAGSTGRAARVSGHLVDGVLHLEVTPAGGAARSYRLQRGANVKLIRCL